MFTNFIYYCSRFSLILIFIAFQSALFSSCSPRLHKQEYKALIEQSPEFGKNFTGFMLYDPGKDETLYAFNSEKYFTPASNAKIFTLYAALQVLGDSVPGIKYRVSGDSLFFTGTGDPSLLNPGLPESKVFDFLKLTDKKLFYVKGADSLKALGPGWAWDDYNDNYSAEKSNFPVYGNIARFRTKKQQSEITVVPALFADSVVQKNQESLTASLVQRNVNNNTFTYNAGGDQQKTQKEVPFKWSPQLAVKLLSDTLGKPVELLETYNHQLDQTLYSIPADSLYRKMMQTSDNFIAEQIILLISSEMNGRLSPDSVLKCLSDLYLQGLPDPPVWVDGSGLSRYNLFTPRSIVYLWNRMYQEVPQERLFSLLAAGGGPGSLQNQFLAAEPYVFAKTGTLSNNYSISGFLKAKSGKILIFSFMLNNHVDNLANLKKETEKVLWQVHLNN